MNWDKMKEQSKNLVTENNGVTEKSIYARFTPGIHQVRFLPVGNHELSLPYRTIKQHSTNKMEAGRNNLKFALCWDWLFSTQETVESVVQPLAKKQMLTEDDVSLYRAHGCPFCKAGSAASAAGVDKKTYLNMFAKTTNFWNIVIRTKNQEQECLVWSMSNKLHDQIRNVAVSMHDREQPIDILDPRTGWDFSVQAEGEMLQRRYTLVPIPMPCPIGPSIIPHNLLEVVAKNFRNYQQTVDMVVEHYGAVLQNINYKVEGDKTFYSTTGISNEPIIPRYEPPPNVLPKSKYFTPQVEVVQEQRKKVVKQYEQVNTILEETPAKKDKLFNGTQDGVLYIDGKPFDGYNDEDNTYYEKGKQLF